MLAAGREADEMEKRREEEILITIQCGTHFSIDY